MKILRSIFIGLLIFSIAALGLPRRAAAEPGKRKTVTEHQPEFYATPEESMPSSPAASTGAAGGKAAGPDPTGISAKTWLWTSGILVLGGAAALALGGGGGGGGGDDPPPSGDKGSVEVSW